MPRPVSFQHHQLLLSVPHSCGTKDTPDVCNKETPKLSQKCYTLQPSLVVSIIPRPGPLSDSRQIEGQKTTHGQIIYHRLRSE